MPVGLTSKEETEKVDGRMERGRHKWKERGKEGSKQRAIEGSREREEGREVKRGSVGWWEG